MIGFFLFGIPSSIIAGVRGFSPLRWLLAFGLIGLIVVLSLPSARAEGISADEAIRRRAKADSIGAWMCAINLGLSLISLLVLATL